MNISSWVHQLQDTISHSWEQDLIRVGDNLAYVYMGLNSQITNFLDDIYNYFIPNKTMTYIYDLQLFQVIEYITQSSYIYHRVYNT